MANLWWPKSDCLTTWTTKRIHQILMLYLWMVQQNSVSSSLKKDWPARKSLEPGIMNVENQPLVEPSKILLPSMHLKLGLMKNFVKALNQEEAAFTYLLTRNLPQTKWSKIERRYFHWSTNTRPYQGWILRQDHSRRRKVGFGQF